MDYTLILIAVAIAVLIFFQFRSSRKRKQEAEERLATLLPGVEVMTNFGLYGTLVSIDEEENIAELEVAPGIVVKLHRQVILKAVEPPVEEVDVDDDAVDEGEPEFGERSTETPDGSGDTKKTDK
jgi:preprotein translocase subunit YajC